MKKLITLMLMTLFIGLNIKHAKSTESLEVSPREYAPDILQNQVAISYQLVAKIGDHAPILNLTTGKTTYYVKVGNTISKLEDKEGYIIAAMRLGMETILIIPDGKVYRTVSLDLHKDDEALKNAIEVKINEIIIKN